MLGKKTKRVFYLVPVVAALLLVVVAVTAQEPAATTATTITVDSTDDNYSDGQSKTCSAYPDDPCTLRRAINQAHNAGSRPVYIQFNIPLTDTGYIPSLGAWKIQLTGSSAYDLREIYGQTIIDGSTQPGGRTNGPKIIVDGQDTHNIGLILRQNDNEVRGLAFQNFEDNHISVSSDGNTVEDCWFGLSDDGSTLSSGSASEPELDSGIALAANADGNTIRDNILAGFKGAAVAIRGTNNVFSGNWIGANASGLVPLPTQFDKHPCLGSSTWNGGCGITVDDDDNQIGGPTAAEGNHFVGLYLSSFALTNQKPAMDVSGQGHVIQNNVIGLDINGDAIGVCGRGLSMLDGPSDMDVLDNIFVEPGYSAIMANHWTFNGNTLQGNLIERESPWPGTLPGQASAEGAVVFATMAPTVLLSFTPAKVVNVNGTTVTGRAGDGSPCPNCTVELFLDDTDSITETLQSLDLVVADGSGNWTATLPASLEGGQGLRTMSTVPDDFTIIGLDAGTTSNLSVLQAATYQVFLPFLTRKH
jgi:hypothetical protein